MDNKELAEQQVKTVKPRTPQIKELLESCKSVILSTVNAEGVPNASFAPYAQIGNKFYILVSFMSVHTKNLRDQKRASAMFIEDEANAKQIYARNRLTFDMSCSQIERGTELWNEGIASLTNAHGKILDVLVGLEDFIMIELSINKGSYVNGFGSAYFVNDALEVVEHRNDMAHGSSQNK